jgi:hypothetical protein
VAAIIPISIDNGISSLPEGIEKVEGQIAFPIKNMDFEELLDSVFTIALYSIMLVDFNASFLTPCICLAGQTARVAITTSLRSYMSIDRIHNPSNRHPSFVIDLCCR